MQLISAVQSLYSPINNGIYPHMVREKNIKLPLYIFAFLMPVILCGTIFAFITGEWWLVLISGEKYRNAITVFRWLLPLLVISFPTMLFGWSCLGAIEKQKEVTSSTITAAVIQILLIGILIITNKFTLINIAIARLVSELCLCLMRIFLCVKFRNLFVKY